MPWPPASSGSSRRWSGSSSGSPTPPGRRSATPTFWSQFTEYVWTLETLRVAIISALVAAAATTVAAMSLQRKGIATAAFLAVAALLPLALAGHASGNADHETAVNTIAAHLVGASLWVGGLLAARRAAAGSGPAPAHRRRAVLRHGAVVLRRRRGLRASSAR